MSEAPKRIWLQWCEEHGAQCPDVGDEGMTWCVDKINDKDVMYVRAGATRELADNNAALRADLAEAMEMLREVEWFDRGYGLDPLCPFCGVISWTGKEEHAPDCKLNALLSRTTSAMLSRSQGRGEASQKREDTDGRD